MQWYLLVLQIHNYIFYCDFERCKWEWKDVVGGAETQHVFSSELTTAQLLHANMRWEIYASQPVSIHTHYTHLCVVKTTTEWEAMTSVMRIFLERAASDEMWSERELALSKFWEFMKVWEYLPMIAKTYFDTHLENNTEVVQE